MSKDLKTRVKVDTKSAIRSLNALEKKINKIESTINKTNTTSNTLGRNINRAVTPTNLLARSSNKVKQNFEKSSSAVSKLTSKVKKLAGAYLGVMGARALMNTSDTITHAENRLNGLNGGNRQHTQDSLNKMYVSAQNSRMGYTDMIDNASKSMTLAGEAFQGNIDNAIRFQEIMAKSYTLGGASHAEQASSMYQMIQALGSGVLQGDELRSVREGAPLAYNAIEEFAQGVYNTEESLKSMASQGLITSDMVVAAMMNAGESIDSAFLNTDVTFEQTFNNMKNTAIKAFEPVLQMLRDVLDTKVVIGFMRGITLAIQVVAGILQIVFGWISKLYNFILNNWDTISKVFMTLAAIILGVYVPAIYAAIAAKIIDISETLYLLALEAAGLIKNAALWVWNGICAAKAGMAAFIAWLPVNWVLYLIIAVIVLIIAAVIWLSDSFTDACGIIMGGIYATGAFIYNILAWISNVALGLWEQLKAIATNIGIAFQNAWIWAKNCFWEFIADVLDGISKLEPVINGIASLLDKEGVDFGSMAASVRGRKDEYKSFVNIVDAWSKGYNTIDYKNLTDAYNKGYGVGEKGGQWIADKAGDAADWLSGKLNMDSLPGLGDYNLNGGYNMPSNDDLMKAVDNIDDNTGKVADSMKLAEEDLEYLRKLANLEWKKEYTTASINVDMKNYNTLEGSSDLDGIVTKLVDKLYEELDSVADGVYA